MKIKNMTPEIQQDIAAYIQHLLETYPSITQEQLTKYLTQYCSLLNYQVEELA